MVLTPIAADHVQRPRNQGPMSGATHYGVAGAPGDGPYVELWLEVRAGIIRRAAYNTPGCPSSIAAASMLCQLATGRDLTVVGEITAEELLLILGGLPPGKEIYAHKSVEAIRSTEPCAGENT